MKQHDLTDGAVRSTLFRFTLPFLAASLLQFLYGAADLVIVGRFADTAGVSAVSTGSQIMMAVTGLIMGLASGGTVIIGQYWGAARRQDVSETIGTMFTFFSLFAVVMTGVVTACAGHFVRWMRVPEAAADDAWAYIFICGCGIIFISGYNMVSGILRGLGDSKNPMIFVLIACGANILGDLLLVGPLQMGAAGAAIATVFAQGLSLLLSVIILRRRDFPFDFRFSSFRIRRKKLFTLIRIGTPAALQNILVSLSFLIIAATVNNIGLAESAAVGAAGRISDFCMMGPISFFSSISAMTAQNIGAGRPERARQTLRWGLLFSLAFGLVMFTLIQLFPGQAIGIIRSDPAVMAAGTLYLRTFSFDVILVCFVFSLNGFFGGCGRTGFAMMNALVSTFAVRVPVTLLVSSMPGATLLHIGLAAPLASAVQIIIQLIYYRLGRWKSGAVVETATLEAAT